VGLIAIKMMKELTDQILFAFWFMAILLVAGFLWNL
jgi:hypothetical protein